MGIIYKIEGPINIQNKKKIYIGQTIESLTKRWIRHKTDFKNYDSSIQKRYCRYLCNAVKKYGVENFQIELVENCKNDVLDQRETYYIKEYNTLAPNGYNLQSGGKVNYHNDITKELISKKTQKGIKDNINNLRKHSVSKGLPMYISYFKYNNDKNRTRKPRHGYNVYYKPSGKRKTFTVPINEPIDVLLDKAIAALEILKYNYEKSKFDNVLKQFNSLYLKI